MKKDTEHVVELTEGIQQHIAAPNYMNTKARAKVTMKIGAIRARTIHDKSGFSRLVFLSVASTEAHCD